MLLAALLVSQSGYGALPETVQVQSRDGRTALAAYLWRPSGAGPFPAIVMMHGRAGAYSSRAAGKFDVSTLSQRHLQWGEFWAERGYVALHVDSFGARGYGGGFGIHSYSSRPAVVSEQNVRPLDALGAYDYLRARDDVVASRIGLFGWSNGAMAILATLGLPSAADHVFKAAIAFYPGCAAQDRNAYTPSVPLLMLLAGNDAEVSPHICERMAKRLLAQNAAVDYVIYPGAQHAFDDPGSTRQALAANSAAAADARIRAERFFALHLVAQGGLR
jgi:carboxymethylenebutenolidase